MITAILNVYKRPHTLLQQIQAIKNQTIKPTHIMVWVNGTTEIPKIDDPNIIVSRCSHNLKFHARFAYGLLARTEFVAFFDDDSFPNIKWFESCMNCIENQDGIYGSTGVVLTGTNYMSNYKVGWNGRRNDETTQVHLVGHSWFMRRDTLKYLWQNMPDSWENGEDIQLSYFAQKYGGINTFVPPHPISDVTVWGTDYNIGRKIGEDMNAASRGQSHNGIRDSLCTKYLKEGWKI